MNCFNETPVKLYTHDDEQDIKWYHICTGIVILPMKFDYVYTLKAVTFIYHLPFPSYDNSAADDFEHIMSKNRKSL